MEHLWIAIVLAAAALQTARNAGQKHLGGRMSALAAAWTRFGFGLPFAAGYLAWAMWRFDLPFPPLGPAFLVPAALAAALQVSATVLLVVLFRLRNFAAGSTYVRSETIFAAVLGALVFGEAISPGGWIAIAVSVAGVLLLSAVRSGLGAGPARGAAALGAFASPSAGVGLAAGAGFALASFFIRRASLSFEHPNFAWTAAATLVVVLALQTLALGAVVLVVRPGDFRAIARAWRPALFVGATGAFGSMGWFTAMTIQRVAYVKALAQVEFLFALAVSILFFGERPSRREYAGMALVAAGIAVLLLFAE